MVHRKGGILCKWKWFGLNGVADMTIDSRCSGRIAAAERHGFQASATIVTFTQEWTMGIERVVVWVCGITCARRFRSRGRCTGFIRESRQHELGNWEKTRGAATAALCFWPSIPMET